LIRFRNFKKQQKWKMRKRNSEKTNSKEEKTKKKASAKWAEPTTSQAVNVRKEETRENSLMGRAQSSEGVRRGVYTDQPERTQQQPRTDAAARPRYDLD
jgi:hypothetical protein